MADDFESWARGIVTKKYGEDVARETFAAPTQPDPEPPLVDWNERGEKDDPPAPLSLEVIQEHESFAALGVEVFIDVGGWTFVLTPTRERAAHWSTQVGHVGITPEEVTVLGRAAGGPVEREMLLHIAAVKRTFPGAHVLQALKKGEDNGIVQDPARD